MCRNWRKKRGPTTLENSEGTRSTQKLLMKLQWGKANTTRRTSRSEVDELGGTLMTHATPSSTVKNRSNLIAGYKLLLASLSLPEKTLTFTSLSWDKCPNFIHKRGRRNMRYCCVRKLQVCASRLGSRMQILILTEVTLSPFLRHFPSKRSNPQIKH